MFRAIIAECPLTMGVGVTQASKALYELEGVHFVPADQFYVLYFSTFRMARDLLAAVYHSRFRQAWATLHAFAFRRVRNLRKTEYLTFRSCLRLISIAGLTTSFPAFHLSSP